MKNCFTHAERKEIETFCREEQRDGGTITLQFDSAGNDATIDYNNTHFTLRKTDESSYVASGDVTISSGNIGLILSCAFNYAEDFAQEVVAPSTPDAGEQETNVVRLRYATRGR